MDTPSKILKTELLTAFDAADALSYALLAELIDSADDEEWLIHVVAKGPTKVLYVSTRPYRKATTSLEEVTGRLETLKAPMILRSLVEEARVFIGD